MSLEEIQIKIIELYKERFEQYKGGLNLSSPLIPRISPAYFSNRVLVVGQETNTWYRKSSDDLLGLFSQEVDVIEKTCIKEKYDHFIKHSASKYGGKFWEFNRELYKRQIIAGNMISGEELSHCWLNFFSVESCKDKKDQNGRPTQNQKLADSIIELQGDLLLRIIALLEPRLIILLTGHKLDWHIMQKGLNVKDYAFLPVDVNGILDTKMLAKIEVKDPNSVLSNINILRSYHPTYFMARINTNKHLKEKIRNKGLNVSNSHYYTETLLNNLKSIC